MSAADLAICILIVGALVLAAVAHHAYYEDKS